MDLILSSLAVNGHASLCSDWPCFIVIKSSGHKCAAQKRLTFTFKYVLCKFTSRLMAKITVFGVLPAHCPLVLDVFTVLVSIPPLICAGFVCCHCTGR